MTTRQRFLRAALLSALAVAASSAIVIAALAVASGATLRPGSDTSYDTEFIDTNVLRLSWAVAALLGIAGFFSVRVALAGTAGVAITQFRAMGETVRRYDESGWGDGLERLGYLFPLALTVVSLGCVLVGGLLGHRRRAQRQDQ